MLSIVHHSQPETLWADRLLYCLSLLVFLLLIQLHTHTHQVSRYQKRKTNLDFTEARDSEWQ